MRAVRHTYHERLSNGRRVYTILPDCHGFAANSAKFGSCFREHARKEDDMTPKDDAGGRALLALATVGLLSPITEKLLGK